MWIGTTEGLLTTDPYKENFRLSLHDAKNPTPSSVGNINALTEDEKGNIWIATGDGLTLLTSQNQFLHYVHDKKNTNSLIHDYIWSVASEGNGKIWIGTEGGLDLFETATQNFYHYKSIPGDESSLPHNSLRSTYVDNMGTLWLGCFAGGVRKYDKRLVRFPLYHPINSDPATFNLKMTFCFAETKTGDILIGSDGGGLNLFRKKENSFYHFPESTNPSRGLPKGHAVLALLTNTADNDIWIGTYNYGLSHYNASTKTFINYLKGSDNKHLSDGSVYALLDDQKGNLWVGTNNGGVNILNLKTNRITTLPYGTRDGKHLSGTCIRCLYKNSDGKIWIGTYGAGICIYDPASKTFDYLDKDNSQLSNNIVLSIHKDRKGNIWAGTMGGLSLYHEANKTFTTFTEADGLANNVINSIQEDASGLLWLSTKKGIVRFNPITKSIKNFGPQNGLQGYEFLGGAGFTSTSGKIYFGGFDGFNVFDPRNIPENDLAPSVKITGFEIFSQPIKIGGNSPLKKDISITDSISLPYSSSMISFEFSALDFTAPDKNQYAYKLEGFDKDWIYCGNSRTATYTNLDPGKYRFCVKASNNDGVWNEKGTSISIIITPPFWGTWWFRLLAMIFIVVTVYSFFRYRIHKINAQKIKLQELVREQTKQLSGFAEQQQEARKKAEDDAIAIEVANRALEQKNRELEQFAFVASHDLQEPLRTISSFVDLFQKDYKDKLDAKGAKYLSFVLQSSDRMRTLIKDLLEYSRIGRKREIGKIHCNEIIQQVLADLHVSVQENNAEITCSDLPVIDGYATEMKQLFQNLITNAIKFHKPGEAPKIHISVDRNNGGWEFVCKDNGIGIEQKHTERIFVIFQRLHTRNEYEGSGIGLANCKKIVELHGGNIWVESVPGEGSAFHFTVADFSLENVSLN